MQTTHGNQVRDESTNATAPATRRMANNNASQASFEATFTACAVAPTITTSGTQDPAAVAVVR